MGAPSVTSVGVPTVGWTSDIVLAGLAIRRGPAPTRTVLSLTSSIDNHRASSTVNVATRSLPLTTNVP